VHCVLATQCLLPFGHDLIHSSVVQLKSINKSSFALSFARVLMSDMTDFASKVRGYNATVGVLTPA
jgi:hypothetical protein